MTPAAHTPGPWWIDADRDSHDGASLLLGPGGERIAELLSLRDADDYLIAAAPDLLHALIDAHDALGEVLSPFGWEQLAARTGNESWIGLKERIDAAIIKAMGQAE